MKNCHSIKRKEEGSNIYIWVISIFLFLVLLISLSLFERSADTISDNLKTSLDTANLAATTVNVEHWLKKDEFGIVGCVSDSTTCTEEEKEVVLKRFNTFQTALMENVGLTDQFEFSGGTCGWACNYISSGTLKIDKFIIYEDINGHVYSYTIEGVTTKTTNPTITKKDCGALGVAKTEEFKKANGTTVSQTITGPTILTKVEFPVNIGFLAEKLKNLYGESDESTGESMIVAKHSITSIKR